MSAVEGEREAAIRQALGLPATTVVARGPAGWLVHVTDEQADLAFNLARKLGDSAIADTFVTAFDGAVAAVEAQHGGPNALDVPTLVDPALKPHTGHAADRERYVTERAETLAAAFRFSIYATGRAGRFKMADVADEVMPIFRDLIDRGVLK